MSLLTTILRAGFARRERAIDRFRRNPVATQERMFRDLLRRGADTAFGREFGLREIRSAEQFRQRVPTFDYERFKPYIERMTRGSGTSPFRGV